MSLPEINKRDSANAECKKFKPLTDREAEVYYIGLERGFEEAKKQLLAKIKEQFKKKREYMNSREFDLDYIQGYEQAVEVITNELEGELKVDSASVEADAVKEGGLK